MNTSRTLPMASLSLRERRARRRTVRVSPASAFPAATPRTPATAPSLDAVGPLRASARMGSQRIALPAMRRHGPRRDAALRNQIQASLAARGGSSSATALRPSFVSSRGSRMLSERLGWEILVHTGKVHLPMVVESKRMGRRFGDYVPTKMSSGKR